MIADYLNDAARECSITPPASWVSATGTTEQQFLTFVRDTVRELLQRHDWNAVTTSQTIAGTGVASYALATDFLRLGIGDNAIYETSPNRRPVIPIADNGDWTEITTWNWAAAQRYYRLAGSNIEFFRALESGGSVTLAYVSKNWAVTSGGTAISAWTNDGDVSYLPGPLLQLGVIWRWRRHKGIIYADRKAEFESELARYVGDDKPRRKIDFTNFQDASQNPMRVPIPDVIQT